MAHPNISPDIKSTLLGQLFLTRDMSDSYKAFLSDNKPSPEYVATTPLPFTLKPILLRIDPGFCDRLIYLNQHLHTVGFSSSYYLGEFLKLLKKFVTSDMDDRKDISSRKIIEFYKSTKRCAHNSGGQKSQTTPNDACKDDGAQFIVGNISPRRPRPESSKNLTSIFDCFEIE